MPERDDSETVFRHLIEHTSDLVTIVDSRGTVRYQNPVVGTLIGWSAAEVTGRTALDFVHPADRDRVAGALPRGEQTAFRLRHRNGSWRHFEAIGNRLPGGRGELAVTSRDVTHTRALQDALERAERVNELGKIAAKITHEFNNVLMAIAPWAAVAERQAEKPDAVRGAIDRIQQTIRRAREITQEILRYARTEEPDVRTFDVRGWLEELGENIGGILGSSIDVRTRLADGVTPAAGDPAQLHQVLLNLAINAGHAMPEGGTLTLFAHPATHEELPSQLLPGEWVCLGVQDTGEGIPPDILPRIFEPLFTTKKGRGTGLGLSIAHQIVTRHRGAIEVDSEPGQGTTFRIYLPVQPFSSPVLAGSRLAQPRPRALLVEDDPIVASGIEALLDLSGFEVLSHSHGLRALEEVQPSTLTVAIVDVDLPDIPGTEVYLRLRTAAPALPIVFSTGHGEDSAATVAGEDPCASRLVKPYDLDALIAAMQRAGVRMPATEDAIPGS